MLYYDVGKEPDFIHQAIYPQLCPREGLDDTDEKDSKKGKSKGKSKG